MFALLKKKIAVDTNSEAIRKITTLLEDYQIKYEIRTVRSRGVLGMGMDAQSYARSNIAVYKGSSQPQFVYTVYVRLRDVVRAKQLITA